MIETELEEQFVQFERSIGINEENFAQKFIFQRLREKLINATAKSDSDLRNLLDLGHSNLYLQLGSTVQADIDGFSQQNQSLLHFYGSSIISDACQYLQLPITTCTSAQTIFHRFYTRCSFLKHDLRDVAMGAVFLAGKAQETIKKPRDFSYVFDQIFKIEELGESSSSSQRPVSILDDKSAKFARMKSVVQEMEREILKELGFELYQITWSEQPHRLMYFYINLFKPTKNTAAQQSSFQTLARFAFNYLNDSYRTTLCTFFPFPTILASCIYLAFRKAEQPMPKIAWWTIMETSLQNLRLAAAKIIAMQSQIKQMPKYSTIHAILSAQASANSTKNFTITLSYHETLSQRSQSAGYTMSTIAEAIAKAKGRQTSHNFDAPDSRNSTNSAPAPAPAPAVSASASAVQGSSSTNIGSKEDSNNFDMKSKFSRQNGNGSGASPSEKSSRKRSPSVSLGKKHGKSRRSRSRSSNRHRDRDYRDHRDRKEKDSKKSSYHSSSRRSRSKDKKSSHQHGKKSSKSPVDSKDRKRRTSEEKRRSREKAEESSVTVNGGGGVSATTIANAPSGTSSTQGTSSTASVPLRSRNRDNSRSRSKSKSSRRSKHHRYNNSPDESSHRSRRHNSRDRKKHRKSSSTSSSRSRSKKQSSKHQAAAAASSKSQQPQQSQPQPQQQQQQPLSQSQQGPQFQQPAAVAPVAPIAPVALVSILPPQQPQQPPVGQRQGPSPSPPQPVVVGNSKTEQATAQNNNHGYPHMSILPPVVNVLPSHSIFSIEPKPSNSIMLGLAFDGNTSINDVNKQKESASTPAAPIDTQKKKDILEQIRLSIRQKSNPVPAPTTGLGATTVKPSQPPSIEPPVASQQNARAPTKPELELSKIKSVIASAQFSQSAAAAAAAAAAKSARESSEDATLEKLRLMREQFKMKEDGGR